MNTTPPTKTIPIPNAPHRTRQKLLKFKKPNLKTDIFKSYDRTFDEIASDFAQVVCVKHNRHI